jgi:hypothetical protein
VTDNSVDKVSELVRECNDDADQILTALRNREVSGFRAHKSDELEGFFEANGYIDPAAPLTPEQIRVRVIDQLITRGWTVTRQKSREGGY